MPEEQLQLPGLTASPMAVDSGTAKVDLTLSLVAEGSAGTQYPERRGTLWYSTDLFERGAIRRMLGHFERLLDGIVADPGQRIGELPLLTEAERHQLLVEWNDTARAPQSTGPLSRVASPRDAPIDPLFEAQVERSPEAVALVDGQRQWTYRELNARADRLADYLRARGVGPDRIVAVRLPRSAELIAALWGVLKAGGAYLPLDPHLPAERLKFTLEDAAADVVITLDGLTADLPADLRHVHPMDLHVPRHVIRLDAEWEAIEAAPPVIDPCRPIVVTWPTLRTLPARRAVPGSHDPASGAGELCHCRRATVFHFGRRSGLAVRSGQL